ncbi:MAG: hypothetical protein LC107_04730 [Chitinophagales bacterium]|nr:hypothetical protein [Chitinophagales bacterium]
MRNLCIFSLLIVFLSSCYEDRVVFIPNQQYMINNDLFLASLVGSPESFLVNIDEQDHISLPGEISLVFPENKIIKHNNVPLAGKIKIDFKEYTAPKTGLMTCPETTTHNSWINSERVFYLKLSKDNESIKLTEPLTIYFPAASSMPDVMVYTLNTDSPNGQWNLSSALTSELAYGNWTIHEDGQPKKEIKGYKLSLTQAEDQILLGKPLGNKGEIQTQCTVDLPKGLTNSNSMVYFIASQINMVVKLDYDQTTQKFYTQKGIFDHNIDGKMVVISQISEDEYYFGMTNAILGKDTRIAINGSAMTLENIKAVLNKL